MERYPSIISPHQGVNRIAVLRNNQHIPTAAKVRRSMNQRIVTGTASDNHGVPGHNWHNGSADQANAGGIV